MDKIKELLAMDDAGLNKAFGFTDQLTKAKESLKEMDALTGDARKTAEDRLDRMFTPNIYPGEFGYIVDSAKRKAAAVAAKANCACTGSDMLTSAEYPDMD